jgi:hypothetical protein
VISIVALLLAVPVAVTLYTAKREKLEGAITEAINEFESSPA